MLWFSRKSETPHLGLTRSSLDENRINIEERIALARRTLYSLIKTEVHGTNVYVRGVMVFCFVQKFFFGQHES
jgi:hypothetical protein